MRTLLLKPVICAVVLAIGTSALGAQWHVSPSGNDDHDGSKLSPFRTIERAREEVRKAVAAGLQEPATVLLRGGVYELSEPLQFGPQDSGTEKFAVTYATCPGETVVVSGGRRIANWTKDEKGRWTADLPDVKSGKWFFRQLTVDDRRAVRARWPKEDGFVRIETVADGVKRFTFNLPLPKASLVGQDTEMVVFENWSVTRGLVAASDQKQLTTITPMGWIGHGDLTTASPGKAAYIEHAQAFLDMPGEWFLDRSTGVLTYVAADGDDFEKTKIVAPVLEQLVTIAGTKEKPLCNLRFEGVCFEHTNFPLPAFGYRETQAAHYGTKMSEKSLVQPVTIECTYVEGCRFERCRLAHIGASGIGFGQGCKNCAVIGCTIEDIGGNGIMIGWRGKAKVEPGPEGGLSSDWTDPGDVPVANDVSNCHIRRCGADSYGAVGIYAAFSADTRIAHNLVHNMPYTGISVGFRWDTTPTSQVRCIVEYNHIHDIMKKVADGGGIYTLGFQPGTVLRANHIHDVYRSAFTSGGAPNNGFFIDEGSKGFLFERNVVYATSSDAVRFNQNQREWHTWKDNFFGDDEAKRDEAQEIIKKAGPEPVYR